MTMSNEVPVKTAKKNYVRWNDTNPFLALDKSQFPASRSRKSNFVKPTIVPRDK